MRIISGTARGRTLRSPRGLGTRPTPDRVREALFSILGDVFAGRPVIDLFAGTGSLGLEALSRGASRAVFVEKNRDVAGLLARNAAACGFRESAEIINTPVARYLQRGDFPSGVSVVFADPPYGGEDGSFTLKALGKNAKPLHGSLVVLEHATARPPENPPEGLNLVDSRRYGDTSIAILEIEMSREEDP